MRIVSIFGCGWIGKALIPILKESYTLKASTRSQRSLEDIPLEDRYILNENNDFFHPQFYKTDVVIIAIPPRGAYLETIKALLNYLRPQTQIILLSSTSIYTQTDGILHENSDKSVKNTSLMLKTERFVEKNHEKTIILRLGGLMGYDRIAGKYSAGKTLDCDAFVNYIHRDDVVSIIKLMIDKKVSSDLLNVVAPLHPCKKDIYDKNAQQFGFDKTLFKENKILGKQISSDKLKEKYHYHFLKENPLHFW